MPRLLGLLVFALFFSTQPLLAAEPTKPNIVVFLADDLSWADCSICGGRDVPMPNLDRLAAAGMTLSNAFVASPSCAPSRAALLTGLDPMRNGAMINHAHPNADAKKWPAYFKELGYEVAAIGKTAHYAQVNEYGFDFVSHFNYHQDKCIEVARDWLQDRKSTKPLCLIVGTNWPHVPWPKEPLGDPAKAALTTKMVDTPETRQARAQYFAAVANADRDLGIIMDQAAKSLGPDTLMLFTSDHGSQFPFGKWNLYDAGVRTPLVMSWPGKIKAGSTSTALVSWIDLLPTLVEAAGGTRPQKINGRSILDVLEGKRLNHRESIFLTHSADGKMNQYPIRGVRTARYKYIRNLDPTVEHHSHVDKAEKKEHNYWDSWAAKAKTDSAAAKLVDKYRHRPAEEFYDLEKDPNEERNLIDDPAAQKTIGEMRTALDGWMKKIGDQGMATERGLTNNAPGKNAAGKKK